MAKKRAEASTGAAVQAGSAPSTGRKTITVPAPDTPVFYVNSASVDVSNWDVRIRLGQIQSADAAEMRVAEVAQVFMSHSHARAFVDALNKVLAKIEEVGSRRGDDEATH